MSDILELYRQASSDLGIEAGVIASHLTADDAAKSAVGDLVYIEVIREAELRLKRVTEGYERLRAAAIDVQDSHLSITGQALALDKLRIVIQDDLAVPRG